MPLTIEMRRQLLSTANMWIGQVELLNERAKHAYSFFNARMTTDGSRPGRPPHLAHFETCLLASLRGLYGEDLGGRLFVELSSMTIADVHLFTLSLEHAFQALVKLQLDLSPGCQELVARFQAAWAEVSDVRDLLEHEEEYLIGKGKFPAKVDPNWTPPGMGMSRPMRMSDAGIVSIQVLGRWYDVRGAVAALLALRPCLREETSKIAPKAI
jgi:hypothetical protein